MNGKGIITKQKKEYKKVEKFYLSLGILKEENY